MKITNQTNLSKLIISYELQTKLRQATDSAKSTGASEASGIKTKIKFEYKTTGANEASGFILKYIWI